MSRSPVPPLRTDLDMIPVEHEGRSMVLVRDHLGLVPEDRAFSLELFRILHNLGPDADLGDLGRALTRASGGEEVSEEQLRELVDGLDGLHLLESESFARARRGVVKAWQDLEVRPAALAGSAYPDKPEDLSAWADRTLARPGPHERKGKLACLVAPHIDPQAGAKVYGAAYAALAGLDQDQRPERVVVLGTGHALDSGLVSLCAKDFETPLGRSATDREGVARLERAAGSALCLDDFIHRAEHSVEFQALFLQHLLGPGGVRLVPVLCGSGHLLPEYTRQAFLDGLEPFCRELAAMLETENTLLLVGADLCHIGPKFGHAATAEMLEPAAAAHETLILRALADMDPEAMWRESASVGDGFHVCSFLALALAAETLALLGGGRAGITGRLLDRDLWREEPTSSAVGFAALAFERT